MAKKTPKYLTVTEAIKVAAAVYDFNVSRPTLIAWAKKHDLGYQPAGKRSHFFINAEKWHFFLS